MTLVDPVLAAGGGILELDTALVEPSPYYLGEDILTGFPRRLTCFDFDRVFLVTTPPVRARFGADFSEMLHGAGAPHTVVEIPDGETHKDWRTITDLCERLVEAGVTRDSILVALGGGTVSNLVGLAAGLTYRGIRYVDVPTTLLAQTDGTLSNKQAINGRAGKNQFGLYHRPLFVWADVAYVRHEPPRQVKAAVIEGIKNGLVNDPLWLDRLDDLLSHGIVGLYPDLVAFAHALVESKRAILKRDPTERGMAIVLEYGHTCGHAVEWLSRGAILHGEAVGIGMCVAARLGEDAGITPPSVAERQLHLLRDLLETYVELPAWIDPGDVYAAMLADNKRRGGSGVRFLLLDGIGSVHAPGGDPLVPFECGAVMRALRAVWERAEC